MGRNQTEYMGKPEQVDQGGVLGSQSGEQRETPRVSLLIRAAKLITSGEEILCVVRNISAMGVKIRTFLPIPDEDDLVLETETGERHDVELVWAEDGEAGLRFRNPVEVDHFISEDNKPYSKRPIRLTVSCPIAITAGTRTETGKLVNISRSGAQIDCPGRFSLKERIRLTIEGLPVITARIQWRREPFYGLVFEETFRLDELGRILAK